MTSCYEKRWNVRSVGNMSLYLDSEAAVVAMIREHRAESVSDGYADIRYHDDDRVEVIRRTTRTLTPGEFMAEYA